MNACRRVWIHRAATIACILLAIPGVLWWKNSILFVILLSLSTQAYTSWSSAEASDDRELSNRLDRIEALLERKGDDG
ncbi:hypothetical protein [Paractinoplanes maris]|uniref:hypothetical protein n=1 Tax=Paractinoplanes maris TaxID=1734446 RepID=UPI0020223A56|nr:hypothetical protein [Actinoplanes maris]